jgi:hypothetical protein
MGRISIARLLGLVAAFALGLAVLVNASEFWAGATLLLTLAALLGSVLGVILRGWRGGGWLGFAVFGWGYFFFQVFTLWVGLGREMWSMSEPASAWVFEKANPLPALPDSMIPQPPPQMPAPALAPTYPPPPPPLSDGLPPSTDLVALASADTPTMPSSSSATGLARPSMPSEPNAEIIAALERRVERLEKAREIGRWLVVLAFGGVGAILGMVLARGRPARVGAALADGSSAAL